MEISLWESSCRNLARISYTSDALQNSYIYHNNRPTLPLFSPLPKLGQLTERMLWYCVEVTIRLYFSSHICLLTVFLSIFLLSYPGRRRSTVTNFLNVIFCPHGRTIASAWRYFPSTSSYCVIFLLFCVLWYLNFFTALVIAMPATSNKIYILINSTIDFD